jgi:Protein of unknown function (DUF3105)
MRRLWLTSALAAATLAAAACGGDEDAATTATGPTAPTGPTGPSSAELRKRASIDAATGVTAGLAPDGRQAEPSGQPASGDLEALAQEGGCELMLGLPDEGNTHLRPDEPAPTYETNPPTSGDHDPVPLADGAYLEPPDPTQVVHSLEHGRVAVQYSPELPEADQLALKGLFDEDPEGMLLFPNPEMPYELAATAWTNLIACDAYSDEALAAIAAFRDRFRGKGPERVPL